MCQEKGAYLLNYAGCKSCKLLGHLIERNRCAGEEEDDNNESVNYDRKHLLLYQQSVSLFNRCVPRVRSRGSQAQLQFLY